MKFTFAISLLLASSNAIQMAKPACVVSLAKDTTGCVEEGTSTVCECPGPHLPKDQDHGPPPPQKALLQVVACIPAAFPAKGCVEEGTATVCECPAPHLPKDQDHGPPPPPKALHQPKVCLPATFPAKGCVEEGTDTVCECPAPPTPKA